MREISKQEADELIRNHRAGWWAINASPPVPHPQVVVVSIVHQDNKDYLCTIDEIKVEFVGVGGILAGKVDFVVTINEKSPIYPLVKLDKEQASRIKNPIGKGVEARYGGKRDRLLELEPKGMPHWILGPDGRTAEEVSSLEWLLHWSALGDQADRVRRVADDAVGAVSVSTVFTSLGDRPFETMISRPNQSPDFRRYSTWAEAESGHRQIVEELRHHHEGE